MRNNLRDYSSGGNKMDFKRMFFIGFYLVAGLFFTHEVTAFDRLGVASLGVTGQPTEHPNWETRDKV
jgi:hypothetical protein